MTNLSTNLIIQYTIVGLILFSAVVWVIYSYIKNRKKDYAGGGCCGCSLQQHCTSAKKQITSDNSNPHDCHK